MSDSNTIPAVIEFHSVSKWYGQVIGLNNLSLRLPAGVTGLLGPNGSGKSTLLQLATGQLRPSQGIGAGPGPSPLESSRPEPSHRALPRAGCVLRVDDRAGSS